MRCQRVCVNKNEIITEVTHDAYYPMRSGKYAFHVLFSGAANYMVDKRPLTLVPGSFIFLNHDTHYSNTINSSVEVSTLSVLFDPDFVHDFEYSNLISDRILLDNPVGDRQERSRFIESIHYLQGNLKFNLGHLVKHIQNGEHDHLLLNEYLNHCLITYYSFYDAEIVKREQSLKFLNGTTKTEILKRLSIAKDYMISNYSKPIVLEDIARVACLSVNHFLRTFKQAYQQSPHQFLTQTRLQQAKYLLKYTDYRVNEIVDFVGFECPSSFIRLFRSSFNVTPGQYR